MLLSLIIKISLFSILFKIISSIILFCIYFCLQMNHITNYNQIGVKMIFPTICFKLFLKKFYHLFAYFPSDFIFNSKCLFALIGSACRASGCIRKTSRFLTYYIYGWNRISAALPMRTHTITSSFGDEPNTEDRNEKRLSWFDIWNDQIKIK